MSDFQLFLFKRGSVIVNFSIKLLQQSEDIIRTNKNVYDVKCNFSIFLNIIFLYINWSYITLNILHYDIKGTLSGLRQVLATESPLKMMKIAFCLTLKALFVLEIFHFFVFEKFLSDFEEKYFSCYIRHGYWVYCIYMQHNLYMFIKNCFVPSLIKERPRDLISH